MLHVSRPSKKFTQYACKAGKMKQGSTVFVSTWVVELREVKLQDHTGPEHRGRLKDSRETGTPFEVQLQAVPSLRRAHAKSPGRRRSARCCARASVQCEQYLTAGARGVIFEAVASGFLVPCHFSLGSPGRVTGGSWQFMWKVCTRTFTPSLILLAGFSEPCHSHRSG